MISVAGRFFRVVDHEMENGAMTGIKYITDEQGRKVAVQIDFKQHLELWEDIEDALVSRSRKNEKRIPLDNVKAGLVKRGKPS